MLPVCLLCAVMRFYYLSHICNSNHCVLAVSQRMWRQATPCAMPHHTQLSTLQYAIVQTAAKLRIIGIISFLSAKGRSEIKVVRYNRPVALICQFRLFLQIIQRIPPCHLLFIRADNVSFPVIPCNCI